MHAVFDRMQTLYPSCLIKIVKAISLRAEDPLCTAAQIFSTLYSS